MFKNILVPVDLADVAAAEPALARAVEMVSASGGKLRLIYVRSILPVTYMEFIPPNFDTDQQVECERKLAEVAAGVALPPERISTVVRLGSVYNEGARRRAEDRRRSHHRRLAPADHGELPPRLERLDHRAPRRELGARRAGLIRRAVPRRAGSGLECGLRGGRPCRASLSSPLPPPLPSPFS